MMGCPQCPEPKTSAQNRTIIVHPILDRTELFLTGAWISEIRPEQKEFVTDLIHAIQALKNPYTVPLEAQLSNLLEVSYMVGGAISCEKCRAVWVQEIARKIQVRWHLERGERKKAVWLWIRAEFWGKVWGLHALPILFHRQQPSMQTPNPPKSQL